MIKIMKASAGSGKTYRLARKYISLLLESKDRYAYRHILAVTFTNKATDEMKGRILKELHVLAVSPEQSGYRGHFIPRVFPDDSALQEKARAVLSDILHDYSAFSISTIDRFFQQTLKAFSREIGQFASYQVELDKDSLVAESVDRILDSLTEEDSGLLSWLTDNVLEQIEQGGRYSMDANLLDMAKRLKSVQRQEVLERNGMASDEDYPKEKLSGIRNICRKIISDFRTAVVTSAKRALDVIVQAGVSPKDSNRGFLCTLYDYADIKGNVRIEMPSSSFMARAADPDQWFAKAKAARFKPLVYPFLEAPLEDFCRLFGMEYKVYNTALVLDGQLYGLGVAGELARTFRELMKEKNVLCIDDSNTILRDIIDSSDAPFVYEKLGVRYEHFLLDEFQDTAEVQWNNFSPLIHESDSKGGMSLIVGDVKQSIYRWRGSDWRLLNDTVPDEFPDHEAETLDTNYRSLADVVCFNNAFFPLAASLLDSMNGFVCRDGAEKGPISRIYADVVQKVGKHSEEKGCVSLTFCSRDDELEKVYEAVCDAVSGGAGLSEIAVLVRSNAIGESVASYLIDKGIAVMTDDSLRVGSSMTVRRMVSLMSYADNPQDTVNGYLARTLDVELPEGGTSLMDMAEALLRAIKAGDKEQMWKGESLHIQSFLDCLQDYVASNGNSLRGFLEWWENEDPSVSSPSSGESVRVMTVHKSKGLDFPYVIIPFAENINLYKAGRYWCVPDLSGTPLDGVADGVYDVNLSKASENTLFAEDYRKENFLQQVDNMNTIYVAMTRAALGMHIIAKTPSDKFLKSLESGCPGQFSDFSQLLYWFVSVPEGTVLPDNMKFARPFDVEVYEGEDGSRRFDVGKMPCFGALRRDGNDGPEPFEMKAGEELPSIPLNPFPDDPSADALERGRLRLSADAVDFFAEDGTAAGISASNRVRGVALHDILSYVRRPAELGEAVRRALMAGVLTSDEASEAESLLSERIGEVQGRGWFPEGEDAEIYNETDIVDTDGEICRPDRVVVCGGEVVIIDYKFGEHRRQYERQLIRYADLWRRMGHETVSAFLWYVHTGEVVPVCGPSLLPRDQEK